MYKKYIAGRHTAGKLLTVAVADALNNGLSASYTFFDPDAQYRAPGVYAILWLIDETRRLALDYLYPGYWIKQCRKVSYKVDDEPTELYLNDGWGRMEKQPESL